LGDEGGQRKCLDGGSFLPTQVHAGAMDGETRLRLLLTCYCCAMRANAALHYCINEAQRWRQLRTMFDEASPFWPAEWGGRAVWLLSAPGASLLPLRGGARQFPRPWMLVVCMHYEVHLFFRLFRMSVRFWLVGAWVGAVGGSRGRELR
jgi:hypothetical protein